MTKIINFLLLNSLLSIAAFTQSTITKGEYKDFLGQLLTQYLEKQTNLVAPSCERPGMYNYNWFFTERELVNALPEGTCRKFETFMGVIADIDSVLESHFITNSQNSDLNVVVLETFDNAFYADQLGSLITMPYTFVQFGPNGQPFTKHPKFFYPVVMHEYGHYIIEKNYGQYLSKFKSHYTGYEKLTSLMTSSVHELLADVLTVTLTEDPRSVSDAMYYTGAVEGDPLYKTILRLRQFGHHLNDLKSVDSRIRSLGNESSELMLYLSGHTMLTPVRYHLYKYFISNPLYNQNKGQLIKSIFDVVIKTLLEQDLDGFLTSLSESPANAITAYNQSFIEALNNNL